MKRSYFTISLIALVIALVGSPGNLRAAAASASEKAPATAPEVANHPLTIDGTATMVGKWACGGDATVQLQPAQSAEPVPGLASGVRKVLVTAPVSAIACGNGKMDDHLRKALKEKEYPEIRYQAEHYTLIDNGTAVQTSGEITIAGVTRPIDLGATLTPLPEGGLRAVGTVEINMADFGVKPPSLFLGTLKVAKVVVVKFNAVVQMPQEVVQAWFSELRQSEIGKREAVQ